MRTRVTVVRVTHDLAITERAAHCLLPGGRVAAQGPPGAVPTDEAVQAARGLP